MVVRYPLATPSYSKDTPAADAWPPTFGHTRSGWLDEEDRSVRLLYGRTIGMLRKKLAALVAAALMALMILVVGAMPAFAQGPSACSQLWGFQGQFISSHAGSFSGESNPGGITAGLTPLVPTGGFSCNPTFTE